MAAPGDPAVDEPEVPDDGWDGALRHAFAPADGAAPSVVMQSIELRAGCKVHVALRDLGADAPPLALQPRSVDWAGGGTGRYRVGGEIARGGSGQVLLAHDSDLGRDVAVKVLREEHADDPAMLQRFVEEAQIGGQLQHPGIVPVYELGLDLRQRPYFTMKLVHGATLAALLDRRGAVPGDSGGDDLARLLPVFARVCETVAYAHARGVVHRDLKPGNVMVGEFGEVLVMDWGFAKVLGRGTAERTASITTTADGSVSVAGTILGTPAYMPPEQAAGAVDCLDARADVFALGAILCEILTGHPPYLGPDLLAQARAGLLDPAYARLARCGGDPALATLATQCLQRDPAARPASAAAVSAELARYFSGRDARAQAAFIAAAAAQASAAGERKRRRLAVALGVTALALVAVAAVLYLGHRDRVEQTAREANALLAQAWQRVAAGDLRAAKAAVEQARTAVRAGTPDPALTAAVADAAARVGRMKRDHDLERTVLEALLRGPAPGGPGPGADRRFFRTMEVVDALRAAGIDVRRSAGEIASVVQALQSASAEAVLLRALHELALQPDSVQGALSVPALLGAADRLDPDVQRVRVRSAWSRQDAAALRAMAVGGLRAGQPAATLELLAMALLAHGERAEALALLTEAHERASEDFWVNHRLALLYPPADPQRRLHRELAWAVHPLARFGPPPGRPGGPPPRGGRRGR